MFIGADAGRQNLRNRGVGNGGESPVDGAGGVGIPLVRNISLRHDKGKGTVLVVDQIFPEISRFDPSKGHGDPAGKADGEDRC